MAARGTNLTVDAVPRLWLILNDLVQEESYLEIRASNSQPSIVFAIRLNPVQTESWLTNLSAVLQPLTGGRLLNNPMDNTWSLKTTNVFNVIQLAHVGEWTVLSTGPRAKFPAGEITARIRRDSVPFVSSGTNLWLEAAR